MSNDLVDELNGARGNSVAMLPDAHMDGEEWNYGSLARVLQLA